MHRLKYTFLLVLLLGACGGGGASPGAGSTGVVAPPAASTDRPASVERTLSPGAVDPTLAAGEAVHYAINPSAAATPKGRLVVALPGTGGIPANVREYMRTAAPRGYHVIGLTYPNAVTVADYCSGRDADCTGNTRREIITGADTSAVVAVSYANSIVGRLTRLLSHLNQSYPAEGWGRFLAGGVPDWSLITVTGHSQGSGHAAYMGKLFNLERVVMFSGPSDYGNGVPATWLSLPNVTPASRYHGFTHQADELVPYALVRNNWGLLGLGAGGEPASVDGTNPPYGNSRQLFTNAAPNPVANTVVQSYVKHLSPLIDGATPLNAQGVPIYTAVWQHLAFP